MVKMTIVGRVSDGLPLAQGPRYVGEEDDDNFQSFKQQAECILKEISRSGSPPPPKMTIRLHHHSFNYMVENGVCFITLCDSSYPRKLAFHYLQDLVKELDKFDGGLVDKITKPYSFVRFDGIIGNVRRQYTDTRTQSNLSKLNANRRQDLDIISEEMSTIVERRRRLDMLEKTISASKTVSPIWCSPLLEEIALKWTPIAVTVIIAATLLFAGLNLTESLVVMTF